jgi:membrane protease YdiL (CAAX protease family)
MGIQAYEWIIIVVSIIAVIGLIVGLVYLLYRKYGAPNIIANIFWNASKGKIRLRRFQREPKAMR